MQSELCCCAEYYWPAVPRTRANKYHRLCRGRRWRHGKRRDERHGAALLYVAHRQIMARRHTAPSVVQSARTELTDATLHRSPLRMFVTHFGSSMCIVFASRHRSASAHHCRHHTGRAVRAANATASADRLEWPWKEARTHGSNIINMVCDVNATRAAQLESRVAGSLERS